MTPKERVRAAIEHRESDIVPVGEWIVDYEPASLFLGRPTFVRGKLNLAMALWEGQRDDIVSSVKYDLVELTRRLDCDLVCADLTYPRDICYDQPEQLDNETWQDRHGNVLRYSELTQDLMLLKKGRARLEPLPPDRLVEGEYHPDHSELEVIEHVIKELGKSHFIFSDMKDACLPVFSALWVEDMLYGLADNPEQVAVDFLKVYQRLALRIPFFAKLGFDAVIVTDDYGSNSGPFCSPALFRRVFVPALKHMCEVAHANNLFLICHSCGNLRLILPDMIEAGIDVYQSIQPLEDIASLKRDFGKDICIWGGVSNHDLVIASPHEIRRQVVESIKACAPGGGFILGSSHSITVQTPLENIIAYLEAAGRHPQPALPTLAGG